jgi:RNA polymerase sigma-70 factor, ECF subfamily
VTEELATWVVAGVARRDPGAIATCYAALADPLYRYLVAAGADPTLAEDLVEDTFVELVEAAPPLRGGVSGLRAWLFRAARNNLLDARRKVIRRGDQPLDEAAAGTRPEPRPGPEELALAQAGTERLRRALDRLSPDQREVLALRFVADLTGPEVAAATGRTVGAVKALQHRGLASLAKIIDEHP